MDDWNFFGFFSHNASISRMVGNCNAQTESRIGFRRCSASPDIITGFEARRRLISRYEHSRNERNDRERQENIRDYQPPVVRSGERQKEINPRARRTRCNQPLFAMTSRKKTKGPSSSGKRAAGRAANSDRDRQGERDRKRARRDSDSSSDSERKAARSRKHSKDAATRRDNLRHEDGSRELVFPRQNQPLLQEGAVKVEEEAPRKILVAKRRSGSDSSDMEPESSTSRKPTHTDKNDAKGRDPKVTDSAALVADSRIDSTTKAETSTDSSKDSSSDEKSSKKKSKKTKKERKKSKKSKKKLAKTRKVAKKEKKKSKKSKVDRSSPSTSKSLSRGGNPKKTSEHSSDGECQNVGSSEDMKQMRSKMAPMTKEEYEKQQSVIRREVSPTTGRVRLIKGTGEILEEIVSRDRHKAINRLATIGDGQAFQAGLKNLKKN